MKTTRRIARIALMLAAAAALVFSCITITDIIFPDNPQVNSEIDIVVKTEFVTETDEIAHMVFAVLAPKSWALADNASATFSTEGYSTQGYADVTDEALVLIESDALEFKTQLPWSQAYQSEIGLMDNYGPVEWTVFRSQTTFNINDKVSTEKITATVKLHLKTGPTPIKFNMGFGVTGDHSGFGNDRYSSPQEKMKVMEVSGSGSMEDYTKLSFVSTVPATFRYGDIFSVVFSAKSGDELTDLAGEENVYMLGRAVLSDGTVVEVNTASDFTLMTKTGDYSYQKYIYPRHFFGLSADKVIEKTYFWFTNAGKTVQVTDGGEPFEVAQSAN